MKYERLTTNNVQSNKDFLLNFAFVKDGEVYLHGMGDDGEEIRLCDYIAIRATSEKGCDRTPQDILDGACNECNCELAALNIAAIQAAELRNRLVELEDKIESGQLVELTESKIMAGWAMKPLTIEELKALEVGDWVWVIILDSDSVEESFPKQTYFQKSYSGIEEKHFPFMLDGFEDGLDYEFYGTEWLAYKNKEQAEAKGDLYQIAFEHILDDIYVGRLKADTLTCSSCPYLEEILGICQNQGLYEDCKSRWKEYYLSEAERRLAELKGENNDLERRCNK